MLDTDEDIPRWCRSLGIPGLFDVHTHFLPERMMRRVWAHFDEGGRLIGRNWPITYRWSDADRVAHLRAIGVRRWTALAYAHRPDMAADLNDWTLAFAERTPECVPSMTFFPEPGVQAYVDRALRAGARIAKLHLQVGAFDPADPLLDPVWGTLADAGLPVVVHAGSSPVAAGFTGPAPFERVLRRHSELPVIIAHMGAPEYAEFIHLARTYPQVRLDTTMVATDFFAGIARLPEELLPAIRSLGLNGKIMLGTDFPNIPYSYVHQLTSLIRLDLGDEWMRAVYWSTASELFREPDRS